MTLTKKTRQAAGAGTWVRGTVDGHRFDALVFPEHAMNSDWEIGASRISKLHVRRLADRRETFNWDRGIDVPAADAATEAIVEFLAANLANRIYN